MKEHRHEQILQYLAKNQSMNIGELSEQLGVSPMTLRRDLDELAARSMLIRTHGGAIAMPQGRTDTPFGLRAQKQVLQKCAIAKAALQTVTEDGRLFLGSGTSVFAFAKELRQIERVTIVTDSIHVAQEIIACPGKSVVMTGGELRGSTMSLTGPIAENSIAAFRFDAVYVSVTAVDLDGRIFLGSMTEMGVLNRLLESGNSIYILADSSKIGNTDFVKAGSLRPGCTLITDGDIPPASLEALRAVGCNLIVAPLDTDDRS